MNTRVSAYPSTGDKPIFLTTTNKVAEAVNEKELLKIKEPERTFEAEIDGNF
jgi:hypothetical protein